MSGMEMLSRAWVWTGARFFHEYPLLPQPA
jgi:hypothetical protein